MSTVLTPELLAMRMEPGAEYVGLGYEVEYLGRWGKSTGQTPADWHVSNLTDNSGSGSAGITLTPPVIDFRLSCSDAEDGTSCHPDDDMDDDTPADQPDVPPFKIETNKGV